mgnify:CR=1 FL=1
MKITDNWIAINGRVYIIIDKILIEVDWIMYWDHFHISVYKDLIKRKMRYKLNKINLN